MVIVYEERFSSIKEASAAANRAAKKMNGVAAVKLSRSWDGDWFYLAQVFSE